MTNTIFKHPALQFYSEITEICKPLTELNIDYFGHGRIDKDGNFSAINNNPYFLEHYFQKKYYNVDIHAGLKNNLGDFILWDTVEVLGESASLDKDAEEFGIKHTCTIVVKNQDTQDFYHFASKQNNNQLYISNMDLLKLFIKYFNKMISHNKKLSRAYQYTFELEKDHANYDFNSLNPAQRDNFLSALKKVNNITERESECLYWLLRGKNAREIAEILTISKRTIESHLNNIKDKLDVKTKSDLIEKALNEVIV